MNFDISKIDWSNSTTWIVIAAAVFFLKGGNLSSLLSFLPWFKSDDTLKTLQAISTLLKALPVTGKQFDDLWATFGKSGLPAAFKIRVTWPDGTEKLVVYGEPETKAGPNP